MEMQSEPQGVLDKIVQLKEPRTREVSSTGSWVNTTIKAVSCAHGRLLGSFCLCLKSLRALHSAT